MSKRKRKKIKKTSTFLKNHPDFLKNPQKKIEIVQHTNASDTTLLYQW
jgi:hypothetical protein